MEVTFDNRGNVLNAKLHTTVDDTVIYTLETTYGFRGRRTTVLKDCNPAPGRSATVGTINWREKIIEVNGMKKKVGDVKKRKGNYFRNARFWQWGSERKEYEIKYKNDEWRATSVEGDEPSIDRNHKKEKENSKVKATTEAIDEPSRTQLAESSIPASDLSVLSNDGSTTLDSEKSSNSHEGEQEQMEGLVGHFQVPFRPHLFTKSKPPVLKLSRVALLEDEVFLILVFIYSEAKRQDRTNTSVSSEG
ncbi:hypothetical protein E1B28_010615 [Marasmius oreades]|uniref:Uncharacterized protein n=1 Tax=Marasmius oreades TaxID=181124 RepID=A0A9P7UTU7_9AGAR|nr:uncharacterized protein E1B28_010615 [Marasmius oreades]KAG7091594.1 hypothetical protein E1B28_010615 [Marasmius oreades]